MLIEQPPLPVLPVRSAPASAFRRDINGLRAWAVVAVVLFHFGVPGFAGGFVGVDVFFVISGLLMTQIISGGLQKGRFSYLDFVQARAVRIVPALLVLCAALLLAGWFVLLPPDYRTLGSHVLHSLLFLSNVEYWQEAGYFDADSHEKWLLHTWSLSVEWQFYLLLPVFLMLLARWAPGRGPRQAGVAGLLLLSLGACVWLSFSNASASFFLLPTRAWEMLAGGLLALVPASTRLSPRQRQACEALGLGAIVLSVAVFRGDMAWPGAWALIPVCGAVLVLAAQRDSAWTGHPVAQWLGDRSYSIYLWHWPICVVLAYLEQRGNPAAVAAGLLATCVLGSLSYRYIEQPARHLLRATPLRVRLFRLGLPLLLVAMGAAAVWRQQGIDGRFDARIENVAAAAADSHPMREQCHQFSGTAFPACVFGGKHPKLLLVGDSHAAAFVTALVDSAPGGEAGLVQYSYSGCVFVPAMKMSPGQSAHPHYDCEGHNRWVAAQIAAAPPDVPVVLIGRYAAAAFGRDTAHSPLTPRVYFGAQPVPATTPAFLREFGREVTRTACRLAAQRPVFLVRPVPEMPVNVPSHMARKMAWGADASLSIPVEKYMERNAWLWQAQDAAREQCGVAIIDPTKVLCKDGRCHASKDGRPLYFDDNHLSEFGNQVLAPLFAGVHKGGAAP